MDTAVSGNPLLHSPYFVKVALEECGGGWSACILEFLENGGAPVVVLSVKQNLTLTVLLCASTFDQFF